MVPPWLVQTEHRFQTALDLHSQLYHSLYMERGSIPALEMTLEQLKCLLFFRLKETQTLIEQHKCKENI